MTSNTSNSYTMGMNGRINKGGRPSKYDPKFCDEIIQLLAEGYSLTGAAGYICVDPQTLQNWREVHPDFDAACAVAKAKRVFSLERSVMESDNSVDSAKYQFFLKSADPANYRENRSVELSGPGGEAIKTDNNFTIQFVNRERELNEILDDIKPDNIEEDD